MIERQSYLYKITNPKGRVYIGQTVNPIKRFRVYKRNAIPNQKRLNASISKYGWDNHTAEIITSVSESSSDYAEKYLIAYYNSTGKEGMNILYGGSIKKTPEMNANHSLKMKGKTHTAERKAKAAERMIGNNHSKGSVRTEEFKQNVSKKLTGFNRKGLINYRLGKESKMKAVLSFDLNGNFIKEYKCIADVTIDNFVRASVSEVCNGRKKTHKGVIFKFKYHGCSR